MQRMEGNIYQVNNQLIKTFPSVYQFCDGDLKKFVFLMIKGIYPYEYIDN